MDDIEYFYARQAVGRIITHPGRCVMGETIRVEHSKDYTIISNSAIRDRTLSLKSRGLHHLLLSYPNGWEINIEHLSGQSEKDGKDAIASALKELEQAGYLTRTQVREKGKIAGYQSIIRELPSDNPAQIKGRRSKKKRQENPQLENPQLENPQLENPDTAKPQLENPQLENPDTAKPDTAKPDTANPQLENPSHIKYVLDQLSNQKISIPTNSQGSDRKEVDLGNPDSGNSIPQLSASLSNKAESSEKQTNPLEGNFSAAPQRDTTQQNAKLFKEPFGRPRPSGKDYFWAWLPDGDWVKDGGLDIEFWEWIAQSWMSKFGSTIHEAKSNVVSHFRKQPEQLLLRWDEYSSQKLKKESSVPLPDAVRSWHELQHLSQWESYVKSKNLEEFYSLKSWNRAYLEYAQKHQSKFDWSKHLPTVAA